MKLLHLKGYPIHEQLQIEEALLRSDLRNFCIINEGTPLAIVMGISGKAEELLDCDAVKKDAIPVIKRFSGGGTVIVDEETLFVTFICQKTLHPSIAYPSQIMHWSEELYRSSLPIEQFQLKENDYVIGNQKCGGNAQYIKKDRWLHHTSFLFDFKEENMRYLQLPKKAPAYRQNRSHTEFLCKLRDFLPSKEAFVCGLKNELSKRYGTEEVSFIDIAAVLNQPHRKSVYMF